MSKALQNEKTVTVFGKKVKVSKLPIRKIVEVLKTIQSSGEDFAAIANAPSEGKATAIAIGIEKFAPVLSDVVENQVSSDMLLEASFEEVVDLVLAILEVNNVASIMKKLKKGLALFQSGAEGKRPAIG